MSAYLLARRHCLLPSSCGTSCGTSCTVCLPSFPRCTLLAQPPPDILRHASTVTHSQRIPNAYDNQVPWRIHTKFIKKCFRCGWYRTRTRSHFGGPLRKISLPPLPWIGYAYRVYGSLGLVFNNKKALESLKRIELLSTEKPLFYHWNTGSADSCVTNKHKTELIILTNVDRHGLEPWTFRLWVCCSDRLS